MDNKLHQDLLANTLKLREMLASFSTEEIVRVCASKRLFNLPKNQDASRLLSPQKQQFFLLGQMLTTPEPKQSKPFGEEEWHMAVRLLNAIFNSYAFMFWPKHREDVSTLTAEWHKVREIAMPAFLHYFNTGLLASIEQISDRIRQNLIPFDATLKSGINISATEALAIIDWISQFLQKGLDDFRSAAKAEQEARIILLDLAQEEGWGFEEIRSKASSGDEYSPFLERFMNALQGLHKVRRSDLQQVFGLELTTAFWERFVSRRGEVSIFLYMTDRNIAEEKPLFQINDNETICPVTNALYYALLLIGENCILASEDNQSYLKKRDKALEEETEIHLRRIFGESAEYYAEYYETPNKQSEHDLIIRWGKKLFVIEAKASPPVEPLRDPEKAFTKIRDHFKSNKGIQRAYEQANKIRGRLAKGEAVQLYDNSGRLKVTIMPQEIDSIYCICVTREDFGPLAVDLSLLLDKAKDDSYPWAVNILDLENLIDAWNYFGWGGEKFCEYLEQRERLHGRVLASDELEVAGFFIKHGSLNWILEAGGDSCFLPPDYSDVFDQIYLTRRGGETVVYNPTEPFIGDMRKMLTEMLQEGDKSSKPANAKHIKQGRNEPCICGSGKKHKRCCGK